MPSHPLQKRCRPLLFCSRAPFDMPQQRHEKAPASKSRGGQLSLAAKMAGKVKDASEAIKFKEVAAKGKVGKRTRDSSEASELEESESDNSSAVSSLVDLDFSQKPTEGEPPRRRTKPDPPPVEVTFHFSIFVHSHVLI